MNTINQKNVLYGISGDNRIPYGSGSDIALNPNPNDSIDVSQIDSVQLNNLIAQLQDNDRFVKRQISNLKSHDGSPKVYKDDELRGLPDGSKVMGGSGTEELVVLQKKVVPISATVEQVGPQMNVLCMRNFGNWLLVGTDDGLFATTDGIGYEGPKPQLTGEEP